jgi:hypothetical protein
MNGPVPDGAVAETAPAVPIQVKASAAPIFTSETFKPLVVAACALVADRLLRSDTAVAASIPAGVAVATAAWSLLQRLHTWRCMRLLTEQVPDEIAMVGAKPWWVFWS